MNRRYGPALLALALVAADLIRPSVSPGIPLLQAALVAAALGFVWFQMARIEMPRGDRWALMTLALLSAILYLRHPRSLDADGVHYFTYARSLIADRDLDLANDYALLGQEMYARNVLPIGAPLVWGVLLVPLYLLLSLAGLLTGVSITGAEPVFIAAACLVSIVLGCAALFLLYRELRAYAAPIGALLTVVLLWFGGPLRFYMRILPSFAHAIEFFAAVCVLVACLRLRESGSTRRAWTAGLACGLVYLVRSQDGLLLAVPAIFIADAWLLHRDGRRLIREGAATLAGFAVLAWIQSAVWWSMFGTPFLVPHKTLHGEAFATASAPRLIEMLFSHRGGLFSTYPVMLVAVIALPFAWKRNRPWVVAALVVLALQWRLNASIFDWYQVRRFTGTIPLLAIGLVMVAPGIARAGLVVAAGLTLLVHQYDVAIDSLRPLPGAPVTVRAALRETADSMMAPAYGAIEYLSPHAAVAILEGYTGSTLLQEGRSDLDLARDDWWMRLPIPARRLSRVETEEGSLCRWVDGREARVWLPLRGRGELRISFEIRAIETETPQRFDVVINGRSLGPQEIAPAWQTVRFIVPPDAWHEGTNEIVLKFEQAPLFFRVRGYGARVFRAAAIRTITFHGGS